MGTVAVLDEFSRQFSTVGLRCWLSPRTVPVAAVNHRTITDREILAGLRLRNGSASTMAVILLPRMIGHYYHLWPCQMDPTRMASELMSSQFSSSFGL